MHRPSHGFAPTGGAADISEFCAMPSTSCRSQPGAQRAIDCRVRRSSSALKCTNHSISRGKVCGSRLGHTGPAANAVIRDSGPGFASHHKQSDHTRLRRGAKLHDRLSVLGATAGNGIGGLTLVQQHFQRLPGSEPVERDPSADERQRTGDPSEVQPDWLCSWLLGAHSRSKLPVRRPWRSK